MGTGLWPDLRALLRTIRLARSAPVIAGRAGRKASEFMASFERSVRPLLVETVRDARLRDHVGDSLVSYATKACFVVAGYARMAGVPFGADLAVLGLSFARLYDDLLDEIGGDLELRLARLFEDGTFTPGSDLERLLARLFGELERRLARDRADPVYAAARALHGWQVRSRCQRDPLTSEAVLAEVTRGKGGHGTLVIFALMRAGMSGAERRVILDVGEVLQLLDDYLDVELDRKNKIRTLATEGFLTLPAVCRQLRAVRSLLAGYYGSRNAREFLGVCYLTVWICFVRRQWPRLGTTGGPAATSSPWNVVVRPGDNLVQQARERAAAREDAETLPTHRDQGESGGHGLN